MLYFIKPEGAPGPIKIGSSDNPSGRMAVFQSWCPIPLKLIGVAPGGLWEETWVHRKFASARLHSEWFDATDDLVRFVQAVIDHQEIPDLSNDDVIEMYAPPKTIDRKQAYRNAEILRRVKAGESAASVARDYNISRQRVSALVKHAEALAKVEA